MPKQTSSSNVNPGVRLSQSGIDGTARAIHPGGRGSGRLNLTRAAWPDLPQSTSRPVTPVAEADRPPDSLWWAALTFCMEGFAIYGASLHPNAAFPAQAMPNSAKVPQPRLAHEQQLAVAEPRRSWPTENSDAVELACADARPSRHWNWLSSLGETIVTLWTYWRREREIKRAVAALAEYDDRTLRDLGICGRADIERAVRDSRDC